MQMKATNIDKQNKELHTVHKLKLGYVPNINSNEHQTKNTIIDTRKKVAKKQLVDVRIDARTPKNALKKEIKKPIEDTIVEEKIILDKSVDKLNETPKLKETASEILEEKVLDKASDESSNEGTNTEKFIVGDYLAYKDDLNTIGKVISIDENKCIIRWADESTERVRISNLNELQHVEKPVEDIERIPITEEVPIKEEIPIKGKSKCKGLTRKSDEMIILNDNPSVLQKAKQLIQKHKVEEEELQTQTNNAKYTAANEIVELGIQKGMIDKDDKEVELMKLSTLSDTEFADYKQQVLAFNPLDAEIESLTEKPDNPEEYAGLSEDEIEAKKMLNHLRGKGATSFSASSFQNNSYDDFSNNFGPRNLKDLGQDSAMEKLIQQQATSNTSNYKTQTQDLEENLYNLLGDKLRETESHSMNEVFENKHLTATNRRTNDSFIPYEEPITNSFSQDEDVNLDDLFSKDNQTKTAKHELRGFENLQGPTKPLMFGQSEPSYKNPMNTSLSEMFASLDWSTTRK